MQSSGKFWTVSSKEGSVAFPAQNPYVKWKSSTYTADYYKFGIFMDYGCNSSKEAFKEVNKKNSCFCVHMFIELTVTLSLKPNVHSCQQKSIGLKFSKSQTGSDVRYSCHHNSCRFTFPIFEHSCRFSVLHSLQSFTPRIY